MRQYTTTSSFFEKGKVIAFGMRDVTHPGREATSWQFDILENQTTRTEVTIHLSDTAQNMMAKNGLSWEFMLCKRFVRWYRSGNRDICEIEINAVNYSELTPSSSSDREVVERDVLQAVHGYWEEGRTVDSFEISLSCDFNLDDIDSAKRRLRARSWVRRVSGNRYQLNPEHVEKIGEFLKPLSLPPTAHRHFQVVDIDVTGDFAFVIMPFREEEFPQRIYGDVIKPFVDDKFGIRPVRVDEDFTSQNILNKIYTYTLRSDFVIAEISTRNPNVMYELGLALALGKDVIVIENKEYASRTRWPERIFDIDKFPYYRYGDDKELQDSLDKAITAHLSTRKK